MLSKSEKFSKIFNDEIKKTIYVPGKIINFCEMKRKILFLIMLFSYLFQTYVQLKTTFSKTSILIK